MKTFIVLLTLDIFERRHAELIENVKFNNIESLYELLQKEIDDELTDGDVLVYAPTYFMDACNNQDIELELWWVSYVNIEN